MRWPWGRADGRRTPAPSSALSPCRSRLPDATCPWPCAVGRRRFVSERRRRTSRNTDDRTRARHLNTRTRTSVCLSVCHSVRLIAIGGQTTRRIRLKLRTDVKLCIMTVLVFVSSPSGAIWPRRPQTCFVSSARDCTIHRI